MLKGTRVSGKFIATVAIGAFFVLAQPASAQGWSDRVLASVSAWTPWASAAAPSPEAPPQSESAGMFATAMTYVPTFATDAASQASGLLGQAVLLAKSYGPGSQTPQPEAPSEAGGWSDGAKQSMGCLMGGTVGTTAALIAGGENLVNIIAGGIVPAGNPVALYVGLFGVVFASFCAVGQALAPLYVDYFAEPPLSAQAPPGSYPARPYGIPDVRVFYINYP